MLAIALLAATVAIGPEVTSWTMTKPTPFAKSPAAALSLARDSRGLVIAWSAGPAPSHIFLARLDETLRVIDGTLREVAPRSGPAFDASYPRLTAAGGNCALLWRERETSNLAKPNTIFMTRLSPQLDLAPSPWFSYGGDDWRVTAGAIDGDVVVAGPAFLATVNGSNALVDLNGIDGQLDDAAFAPGHVAYVSHALIGPNCNCPPHSLCSCPWHFDVKVVAMRVGTDSFAAPLTLGSYVDTPPFDWAPSIAGDGERWVIVWQSRRAGEAMHDILGAVLTPDGNVQPLTIASDANDHRLPTVVAVAPGRFVVGYEIDVNFSERQLAGRHVDFNPPHHRPGGK